MKFMTCSLAPVSKIFGGHGTPLSAACHVCSRYRRRRGTQIVDFPAKQTRKSRSFRVLGDAGKANCVMVYPFVNHVGIGFRRERRILL